MAEIDPKVKLNQIIDVLEQLAEDTSVPRNIRRGATEAKANLAEQRAHGRSGRRFDWKAG